VGWEAAGAVLEPHVARSRAARGQLGLGKLASEGGGVGRREKQSRGTGGRRRRTSLQFIKSVGTPL
jgi:hypothetical protein